MNKKIFTFKYCVGMMVIMGAMFFALSTSAAMLGVQAAKDSVDIQSLVQADIFLDSESETINAIKGVVIYDARKLKVEQVIIGNSVVNFWMDEPKNTSAGEVSFSGIIPGGILTKNGQVFSVIFSGQSEGVAEISFKNLEVLLNDGQGTQTKTSFHKEVITISAKTAENNEKYDFSDKRIPEKFSITRTRDASIYNNKWFIVFSAQDKGSGIAAYKVCESFLKKCNPQVSPFVLTNQSDWYTIFVRAYDYESNVRLAIKISASVWITAIIILFLCTFGIVWRYVVLYKRRKKTV